MKEELFKIPKYAKLPPLKRIANEQNARWILRNAFINNPSDIAHEMKTAVRDWLARNDKNPDSCFQV